MLIELPAPQLLQMSGPDAAAFAQAQFANDVRALAPGSWQWNAWLSPQGRVRYFFMLLHTAQDRVLILLRGGEAQALRADLSRFVLRAKVSLQVVADFRLFGSDQDGMRQAIGLWPDPDALVEHAGAYALRLPFGARGLILAPLSFAAASSAEPDAVAQWRLDDIRAGLPELAPALADRLLPHWLGLERLAAFSVAKGCYPGQEIIARLHFKGGSKRNLCHVSFACAALPAPGTQLGPDGAEAALLVQAVWSAPQHAQALAVLGVPAAPASPSEIQVVSRFS